MTKLPTFDDVSDAAPITVELGYGLVHLVDQKRGAPLVSRIVATLPKVV